MIPPATAARTRIGRPLVIGHRGSPRTHPENTLAGIRHALAAGADGVEFDLRLAADGTPVLAHDADLRRTHGERVPVDSLPASGLPVPTLADVLDRLVVEHPTKTLDIELKVPISVGALQDAIEGAGWQGPVVVTSFHATTVRAYAEAGWTAGLLIDDRRLSASDAGSLIEMSDARFLGVRNPVFLGSLERTVHEAGAALWLWTINRSAHMKRAVRRKVDAIITDYPEKGATLIGG